MKYLLNLCVLFALMTAPALAQGLPDNAPARSPFLAQRDNFTIPTTPPSGTVLPTDVVPVLVAPRGRTATETLHLKVLQKLPARFYATAVCETSYRYETNPFQFPTKRKLLQTKFPSPAQFRLLNAFDQAQLYNVLGLVGNDDIVFRVLPNVTAGWVLTPNTRVQFNYFLIRDQLAHNVRLNTAVQSFSGSIQHDFRLGSRANLLADFQCRELLTLHQLPQFDFLPSLSLSYRIAPNLSGYTTALLQLRGRKGFRAPTREIDPFYTTGLVYSRNGWVLVASGTFFQAFREPFNRNAVIDQNSYSIILDFEIARSPMKKYPGIQLFTRVEPIYNFHSRNTPGLAGMDFRFFWGIRATAIKRPLSGMVEQIREDLKEQESLPLPPIPGDDEQTKEKKKPSARGDDRIAPPIAAVPDGETAIPSQAASFSEPNLDEVAAAPSSGL